MVAPPLTGPSRVLRSNSAVDNTRGMSRCVALGLGLLVVVGAGCTALPEEEAPVSRQKIRVIVDADANNELDDQHAIAYTLWNGDVFDVEGITVNRTWGNQNWPGGDIEEQAAEARRVVKLSGLSPDAMPVLRGANGSFDEIIEYIQEKDFDGAEAVNFIIERAHAHDGRELVLIPIGKLTNIALALAKDPSIAPKVRVVWVGANYPEHRGDYNQNNDPNAMNYLLDLDVPFEIALVRGGQPSGTAAVRAPLHEILERMRGRGPRVDPVQGRHGGEFTTFGDYGINLFENIPRLHGDPPGRAMFDLAGVAIVKNPAWASSFTIPAPTWRNRVAADVDSRTLHVIGGEWIERPDNPRMITLWENFDRNAIMGDFYDRLDNYVLAR
jgi:purine nucleosidase